MSEMSSRYDGRFITAEEILQVKESLLKFILQVLKGSGTPAEIAILPELLKILPSFF